MEAKPEWKAFEKAHPIVVAQVLADSHPLTLKISQRLDKSGQSGAGSWLDCRGSDVLRVSVSPAARDRAVRIIDALVKAFEVRGFELRYAGAAKPFDGLSVCIGSEALELALTEEGGGVLALSSNRFRAWGLQSKWRDVRTAQLEGQLNRVMLGFRQLATSYDRRRRWSEERDRRAKAFHRGREELADRVEAEQEAVDKLEADAAGWRRAKIIRAYIRAVEAQPGTPEQRRERAVWAAWAHEQADRLDPLRESPPSVLDTPEEDYLPWSREDLPYEVYKFKLDDE